MVGFDGCERLSNYLRSRTIVFSFGQGYEKASHGWTRYSWFVFLMVFIAGGSAWIYVVVDKLEVIHKC